MSFSRDMVKIGPLKFRRSKFKKLVYFGISVLIAVMFLSGIVLMILTGKQY